MGLDTIAVDVARGRIGLVIGGDVSGELEMYVSDFLV